MNEAFEEDFTRHHTTSHVTFCDVPASSQLSHHPMGCDNCDGSDSILG